jgi:hypothetical protein
MTRITVTLDEDQHIFMIVSHSVLLRMRNVSDKHCRETENIFYIQLTFIVNRAVYEIM